MSKRIPETTKNPRERAFLVSAAVRSEPGLLSLEDSLAELRLLSDTAGIDVVGEATQNLEKP
ncbi:MAG TPA: GTPase HflX, partial [Anaerolineaceae bacterium]|nr:GTPase HflX [Anaerolineaceae bacterium]HOG80714.1 GTPase HflX [Anaerolineaceae bacterium]